MMTEDGLLVSRDRRIGRIRLNRPKSLNSLTLDMVRRFTQALIEFAADPEIVALLVTGEGERGLCAGGDIRALYDLGDDYGRTFWREEYQLDASIARFPKPYIVLMDGLVMGGGVGISAHGNCRVVTERTKFAMPEAGIGFFPDVGATWLLSRSGGVGVYMALSGVAVCGADAISAECADLAIDSRNISPLIRQLSQASSVAQVLETVADFSEPMAPGALALHRGELDACMAADRVDVILERLFRFGSQFTQTAAATIAKNCPTSLKVTLALLGCARESTGLEACLRREYRAACSLHRREDFYEGVRATIIDKDRTPKWRPATLAEVRDDMITAILAGDGSPGPTFNGAA